METYQDFLSYQPTDGQLTNNEINGVYQALATQANFEDIDTNDELNFVQSCIENLYDTKFKLIESDELSKDATLLNNKFVELIKFCKQKSNYKKVGYIFIGFCYYFSLDEIHVYKHLHEKIQMLIKQATLKMCGKEIFKKNLVNKRNSSENKNVQVVSLFSLAGA